MAFYLWSFVAQAHGLLLRCRYEITAVIRFNSHTGMFSCLGGTSHEWVTTHKCDGI